MDQIVNAKLLELQHHGAEVGTQDLWVRVVLHLARVRLLRVQPETLAGAGTAGAPRPLLGTGLTDGRHEQGLHTDTGVVHLDECEDSEELK